MTRTAREVFDDWARDHHADGMERHHRPRVEQALAGITVRDGNYLEVGVGNGYAIRLMAEGAFAGGRCYGLDLSPHMAERCRARTGDLANVEILAADFLTWDPGPDLRFDLIFSMEVFYYFPDIQAGIEHAVSLLRSGGQLLVLVNYYREHAASHRWPEDLDTPMTLWSASEYAAGFRGAGLVEIGQAFYRNPPAEQTDPGTLATWARRP